jgi:hypothetical protein
VNLTSIIAACPVCAAGSDAAASAGPVWALLLVAPFAVAAIAGISVYAIWRRRP